MQQLRVQATNKKATPKCLILKPKQEKRSYYPRDSSDSSEGSKETIDEAAELLRFKEEERNHRQHVDAIFLKSMQEKRYRFQLLTELRLEEMDALIADYSGSTIGWLMRFLTEEMIRLKELRKIHFISLLAQKERWRREAAEAGLRQKENNMRLIYEDLYNKANMSNIEVSQDYLNSIINVDLHEFAEEGAAERTVELAKSIDNDIQEWLNSFDKIQNPLNFDTLRCTLRDVVFPDVTHLAHMYESSTAADYIINEVLFPNIFNLLEPYDIASAITDEHISRLIDDDLYIFSPECDSDCNCQPFCGCKNAKRESEAIIRKIIRRSVPGRRWKTETERIVHENLTEIVESALKSATHCLEYKYVTRPMIPAASHRNLRYKYNKEPDYISNSSSASNGSQYLKDGVRTRISRTKAMTSSRITRELEREESLLYNDISLHSAGIDDTGTVIDFGNVEEPMMKQESEATLYFTKSTFNILRQGSVQKSFVQFAPDPDTTSSSFDDIGIIFADVNCSPLKLERKNNKKYMEYMVKELVHNFIPAEENESDPSVFEEEILKRSSLKQPRLTANDESDDEDIADIYNADYEDDADDDDDDNFEPTIKSILRKIISKILPHDKETVMFKDDLRVTSHKSARIMVAEDVKELEAVSDINEEEELISLLSEDKYELFITESSLMRLQQMECKCTVEREKERYIMNLMKEGKVKIIRKPKLEEEQMEEEQQEEELQMESDKWQFSEYKEEVEEQDVMSNIEEKSQLTIEVEMAKENSEKEETEKKQTEKEKTDQEQTEIEQTVTETDEASTTAVVAPPSAEELPAINETAAADPKEQPSADQGTTAVESSNTKLQGPEPEAEVNPNETAVETTAEAAAEASAEP